MIRNNYILTFNVVILKYLTEEYYPNWFSYWCYRIFSTTDI